MIDYFPIEKSHCPAWKGRACVRRCFEPPRPSIEFLNFTRLSFVRGVVELIEFDSSTDRAALSVHARTCQRYPALREMNIIGRTRTLGFSKVQSSASLLSPVLIPPALLAQILHVKWRNNVIRGASEFRERQKRLLTAPLAAVSLFRLYPKIRWADLGRVINGRWFDVSLQVSSNVLRCVQFLSSIFCTPTDIRVPVINESYLKLVF